MIAASDEGTRSSPIASIGNGITISATANANSQRQRPRRLPSVPARQARPSSTSAPRVTRPQASTGAVTPWSTAILMNRYGTPQMTEAAAKANQARRVMVPRSLAGDSARLALAKPIDQQEQFQRAERLGQEQVGAGLLGVGLDAVAVGRGQHHDRRGLQSEGERHGDERQKQRAGDGKMLHNGRFGSRRPGPDRTHG